jgi:hypothetical protein
VLDREVRPMALVGAARARTGGVASALDARAYVRLEFGRSRGVLSERPAVLDHSLGNLPALRVLRAAFRCN